MALWLIGCVGQVSKKMLFSIPKTEIACGLLPLESLHTSLKWTVSAWFMCDFCLVCDMSQVKKKKKACVLTLIALLYNYHCNDLF